MFTTLQYSPEDDKLTCGELTDKPPSLNQPSSHSACFACRDKKLKCTGQKSGCDRCRKRRTACQYATESGDTGMKRRKSHRLPSPHSISPLGHSSKQTIYRTKRTTIASQEDASADQSKFQVSDTITSNPVTCAVAGFSDGNFMMSPSAALESMSCDVTDVLSFSQIPFLDFTVDDFNGDDVLKFPFEITPFGNTSAGLDSAAPSDPLNGQTQSMSESKLSQRGPSDYRMQEEPDFASSADTSPSVRTDSGFPISPACSCRDMALQILEIVQPQRKRKPTQAILKQLHFTKGIISRCKIIMNCSTCIKVSGLMVLVGVISENLMDVLEAATLDWESKNWLVDVGCNLQQFVQVLNTDAELTKAFDYNCILGDYKVDAAEEWSALVGCLLLFQINRLHEILIGLQKNAITAEWESHLSILRPVLQRLEKIKHKL